MSGYRVASVRRCVINVSVLVAAVGLIFMMTGSVAAQTTTAPANAGAADAGIAARPSSPASYYGLWVLVPPLVAIALAVWTRQVVAALFSGVIVASYMLLPCGGSDAAFAETHLALRGVRVAVEGYVTGSIADTDHIQIMLFTLMIGAMVGVMGANGGTRSIVNLLSRWASNARRGQFVGWLGGHAVFFDDYANTMILGPTLRPLFDRLRISRAKLAYIVDSTAAPVASLAPIGTWIGAEIGYIDTGLDTLRASAEGVPTFLEGVNGYSAFIASIGYRFYAILALGMVLMIALTRRDFGAMRVAERKAAHTFAETDLPETDDVPQSSGWFALLPVGLMVGITVAILGYTGWRGFPEELTLSWGTLPYLLTEADAYGSILYGALAGMTLAVLMSVAGKKLSTKNAMDAGLEGMARMFPAIVILILAWSLSGATKDLQLGQVVADRLRHAQFSPVYLPMAVFAASCLVSFATGTSWGTMAILCPVVVEVAAKLCAELPADQMAQAMPLFNSAVGAVLAGSIFGDHCSPISDTTVLSSIASSCSLEQHVWTQMPYALLAAAVSVGSGNVLCNVYGYPWWMGIGLGLVLLLLVILVIGRKPPRPIPAEEFSAAANRLKQEY
ncbi:MAG: Na+/H+ antiporter NhaC family protein [Phycisphaerae bacterium]